MIALILSIVLWPDQPFSFQEQILEETKPDQLSGAADKLGKIRAPSVFKKTSIGRLPYNAVPTAETISVPPPTKAPTESQGK